MPQKISKVYSLIPNAAKSERLTIPVT